MRKELKTEEMESVKSEIAWTTWMTITHTDFYIKI